MASVISYDGLPAFAVRVFQRRPFKDLVGPLTKEILKRFLVRNKQKFNRNDNKEVLALKCEKYIRDIEDQQKIENEIANPPPKVAATREEGRFPTCMICLHDGIGCFALTPCGHTGCCEDCSSDMMNRAVIAKELNNSQASTSSENDFDVRVTIANPALLQLNNLAASNSSQVSNNSEYEFGPASTGNGGALLQNQSNINQLGSSNQGGGFLQEIRLNLGGFFVPRPGTPRPPVIEQDPLLNQPHISDPLRYIPTQVKCPICQAPSSFMKLHFA